MCSTSVWIYEREKTRFLSWHVHKQIIIFILIWSFHFSPGHVCAPADYFLPCNASVCCLDSFSPHLLSFWLDSNEWTPLHSQKMRMRTCLQLSKGKSSFICLFERNWIASSSIWHMETNHWYISGGYKYISYNSGSWQRWCVCCYREKRM